VCFISFLGKSVWGGAGSAQDRSGVWEGRFDLLKYDIPMPPEHNEVTVTSISLFWKMGI